MFWDTKETKKNNWTRFFFYFFYLDFSIRMKVVQRFFFFFTRKPTPWTAMLSIALRRRGFNRPRVPTSRRFLNNTVPTTPPQVPGSPIVPPLANLDGNKIVLSLFPLILSRPFDTNCGNFKIMGKKIKISTTTSPTVSRYAYLVFLLFLIGSTGDHSMIDSQVPSHILEKKPADSLVTIELPFASDLRLREEYVNFYGDLS